MQRRKRAIKSGGKKKAKGVPIPDVTQLEEGWIQWNQEPPKGY
jgi:hypothetical protein